MSGKRYNFSVADERFRWLIHRVFLDDQEVSQTLRQLSECLPLLVRYLPDKQLEIQATQERVESEQRRLGADDNRGPEQAELFALGLMSEALSARLCRAKTLLRIASELLGEGA
jgi:hypothetical protein